MAAAERTSGLRREEVADLAGVGITRYSLRAVRSSAADHRPGRRDVAARSAAGAQERMLPSNTFMIGPDGGLPSSRTMLSRLTSGRCRGSPATRWPLTSSADLP